MDNAVIGSLVKDDDDAAVEGATSESVDSTPTSGCSPSRDSSAPRSRSGCPRREEVKFNSTSNSFCPPRYLLFNGVWKGGGLQ